MYSRILVPLDQSPLAEQAVPYATLLAKTLKLPVTLLSCVAGFAYSGEEGKHLYDEYNNYLEEKAGLLRQQGLQVATQLGEGDAADAIATEGHQQDDTLIAMCTHGRSGVMRWTLGSVTDKVLRAAHCPMLVIRPQDEGARPTEAALTNVIITLDGSSFAEQSIPHAVEVSRALRLPVTLLRVLSMPTAGYWEVPYFGPEHEPFADLARAQEAARNYLKKTAMKLRNDGVDVASEELREGDPAGHVIDTAHRLPGSLITISTHGRSGPGRWLMGSVADRVIRHAHVPVLVVPARQE